MAIARRKRGVVLGGLGSQAPHLFLSHSTADDAVVSDLARNLNICEVDVWLDKWELRVGDDLHARIADAIAKSAFVAVVLSRHFSESKWIQGEVHQALSREKEEDRTVVLPLLIEDVPVPPVLMGKKYLDFTGDSYFSSLARLVGMIHDLDPSRVEDAIDFEEPADVTGCVRVLRYCGFKPFCIVEPSILREIEEAGGKTMTAGRRASGDRVRFDPRNILRDDSISPALRALMERLNDAWGRER